MIENTYMLPGQKTMMDLTIKETVKETFKSLSLLAGDLLAEAEHETKTRAECIAYLKGAAFIFYKVCQREQDSHHYENTPINSPADAIEYIAKVFPFMTKEEQKEHYKLAKWLNNLLFLQGKQQVELPPFDENEI